MLLRDGAIGPSATFLGPGSASRPGRVIMVTLKGLSMEKWLCWGSLGVSGALLLLFVVDMVLGFPFGQNWIVDIIGSLACGAVGYLAWESFREIR
jgi:hypothetical protein